MMGLKTLFKKLLDVPETPLSADDQFLKEFDAKHPERSSSQQQEIAKHEKIAMLRDGL